MKKLLSIILALTSYFNASAQVKCEVSECFELTSIVFRLAEAPEYVANFLKEYTEDIDNHFAKFKTDPVVEYAKRLRQEQDIAYNAIASAAAFIEIKNGKVLEIKSDDLPEFRWTKESFSKFVDLLNNFYQKSEFSKFYAKHKSLRTTAQTLFSNNLDKINLRWFDAFFVSGSRSFRCVASLCNNGNYGFTEPDRTAGIAITTLSDRNDNPSYFRTDQIIVHEMTHSYITELADRHWSQMSNAVNTIFTYASSQIDKAYSDPKTVANEWLVRLFTLMYFKENPVQHRSLQLMINYEHNNGFTWMDESAELMERFYANRQIYRTIEDFMPQLVIFINYTAAKMAIQNVKC